MNTRILLCALALAGAAFAADLASPALLLAASKGRTAQVKSLLDGGARIESADKNGRTPLMLAAQHGRVETVKLLLARGASAQARDRSGLTAWGLAMFEPAGHGDHQAVLQLLPQPPRRRISIETSWSPDKLASSCFSDRDQLIRAIRDFHLDSMVLDEFARYAASPAAKSLLEIANSETLGMHGEQKARTAGPGIDAVVTLEAQPGVACAGQSDNVTFSIDVRVFRSPGREMVFQHPFAGGVKGLRVQPVDNPRQYLPVWEAWIKPQGESMYWAV